MKKLLVMALVLMVAGGAVAQDYEYQGCIYRIGLFFSDDYMFDDERIEAATNIDYAPFIEFDMHVVMINVPTAVEAYELLVVGLPSSAVVTNLVIPNGVNFGGTNVNHIVGYGEPRPTPSGQTNAILMSTLKVLATVADESWEVGLVPSVPSSINDDGPALVVTEDLWRTNFTPYSHSGCEEDLAPGDFPDYVATAYGDGVVINPPVPVQSHTFTDVKSLFR